MKKQTHTEILFHVMFSTKGAAPLMRPPIRDEIYAHLRSQLIALGCVPQIITGMPDHVHLLFLCNPTLPLCDVVQQLKGNTSHWVNDHDLTVTKFVWEKGFVGFSETGEGLVSLIRLLNNQEEYHSTRSFLQEVDELTAAHTRAIQVALGEYQHGGEGKAGVA